ncbi:MAG: VOC family protein [Acetobacteraceae bacterium]|nr:VOC family protein [Acetobacteraceae bacterium]
MKLDLLGLDHVVLRCRDLKTMAAFYCDVLGCTMDRWREDLGLVHLRAGNAFIDLVDTEKARARSGADEPAQAGAPNMDHFCLSVGKIDAAALSAYLAARGAQAAAPVMRYGATGERLSIYLSDPEGNSVELRAEPS